MQNYTANMYYLVNKFTVPSDYWQSKYVTHMN